MMYFLYQNMIVAQLDGVKIELQTLSSHSFAWVHVMVRGSSSKRNTLGGNDKRVPVKFSDTLHLLRFPLSLCSSAGIIQILIVLYSLVNKRKESAACRSI